MITLADLQWEARGLDPHEVYIYTDVDGAPLDCLNVRMEEYEDEQGNVKNVLLLS